MPTLIDLLESDDKDYVLLQLWGSFRESLINGNQFYLSEARKRLLTQFEDMEKDAEAAAHKWLNDNSSNYDSEKDDAGSFYELAESAGIEYYELLSDLKNSTRLSVVAGLYHNWDKNLKDWICREIQKWHGFHDFEAEIWRKDFSSMIEVVDCFGWKIKGKDFHSVLNECRLVVNVYKHGDGPAFIELNSKFPEYLRSKESSSSISYAESIFADYTHLNVTNDHMDKFAFAISSFWRAVPENTFMGQVGELPRWAEKEILKGKQKRRHKDKI